MQDDISARSAEEASGQEALRSSYRVKDEAEWRQDSAVEQMSPGEVMLNGLIQPEDR